MKTKLLSAIIFRLILILAVIPNFQRIYFAPFLNDLSLQLDNWNSWVNSGGDIRAFPYGVAMIIFYIPSLVFSEMLKLSPIDPMRALEIAIGIQTLVFEIIVWKYLAGSKSTKQSINFFLFSPLIIWVNYFLGLNDFFPSVCLFVSAHYLLSHKYRKAGFLIGIAIGMKFSLALILPFLILFAWDNPRYKKNIWTTSFVALVTSGAFYTPGLYSHGFRTMVFDNKESMKALGYYVTLGNAKILVLPLIYILLLYWIWKAGRISIDVLIAFFGIALLMISAFSPASIGWMLWGLPLMFMNLAREKKSRIQLVLIQSLFLLHSFTQRFELQTNSKTFVLPQMNQEVGNFIFSLAISTIALWSYSNLKTAIKHGDRYKIAQSPLTVSIAGDSGTGKDTLARALMDMFTKEMSTMICGDDYHKYERGDDNWKQLTHLNPSANYLDIWERDYQLAVARKYFEQREYDHNSGKFSPLKPRLSRDFVVSQGLHALYPKLSRKSDLKIFLSIENDLRIRLKIGRDVNFRSQTFDSVLESIRLREEDYRMYVEPQKDEADIHFHLFENDGKIDLKISSNSNRNIDMFIEILVESTQSTVQNSIALNKKMFSIEASNIKSKNLAAILDQQLTAYDQLFIKKPNIPDGALGVMVVLAIFLTCAAREEYYA